MAILSGYGPGPEVNLSRDSMAMIERRTFSVLSPSSTVTSTSISFHSITPSRLSSGRFVRENHSGLPDETTSFLTDIVGFGIEGNRPELSRGVLTWECAGKATVILTNYFAMR